VAAAIEGRSLHVRAEFSRTSNRARKCQQSSPECRSILAVINVQSGQSLCQQSVRAAQASISVLVPGSDLRSTLVREAAKGLSAVALPRMEWPACGAVAGYLLLLALAS